MLAEISGQQFSGIGSYPDGMGSIPAEVYLIAQSNAEGVKP